MSTDLTRTNLPDESIKWAFEVGIHRNTLSRSGCSAALGILFRKERGSPRYFCGKAATEVPSVAAISAASSGSIFRGAKEVLRSLWLAWWR